MGHVIARARNDHGGVTAERAALTAAVVAGALIIINAVHYAFETLKVVERVATWIAHAIHSLGLP